MDLFSPLRFGVHVATDAVKLATAVPRLLIHQLNPTDRRRYEPTDTHNGAAASRSPAGGPPAPGANGSQASTTPGRAVTREPGVQRTGTPPEPTSAAGASGGIAGTAAAPGDAAAAGAPDPTASSSAAPAPRTTRQGARRQNDVRPPATRVRRRTEPKRSEIDRRRAEQRESAEATDVTLAETEGGATPGATLRVDEPWDGYGSMKAGDIVTRLKSSDAATKAVVRLYEQTHKKRKSILDATS
jgi:hypothetical protein